MDNVWIFQLIFGVLQAFFILALAWLIGLIKSIERQHNGILNDHNKRISSLERSMDVDIADLKHYKDVLCEISINVKELNLLLTDPKFFERCPNRLSKGG